MNLILILLWNCLLGIWIYMGIWSEALPLKYIASIVTMFSMALIEEQWTKEKWK